MFPAFSAYSPYTLYHHTSKMNPYQAIISHAKESINKHLTSHSNSPQPKRTRRSSPSSKPASFKVTERIYTSEKQQFMEEVKLLSVPKNVKSPFRHLRAPKSFAKMYGGRRRGLESSTTLSPGKAESGNRSRMSPFAGSPDLRRSTGSSPIRSPALTVNRSVHLHTIMDICDHMRVKPTLITEVRKQQAHAKHYQQRLDRTEVALERLTDSPIEVLEPLYNLHKESDLSLRRDAVVMANEGKNSADEGVNQVKMMLARGGHSRRSASQS